MTFDLLQLYILWPYYPHRLYSRRRGVERSVASVYLSKTAWAITTTVGRHIVHDKISAYTDPKVERSNHNPNHNLGLRLALRGKRFERPAWVCMTLRLYISLVIYAFVVRAVDTLHR